MVKCILRVYVNSSFIKNEITMKRDKIFKINARDLNDISSFYTFYNYGIRAHICPNAGFKLNSYNLYIYFNF